VLDVDDGFATLACGAEHLLRSGRPVVRPDERVRAAREVVVLDVDDD
jgi:hypothetical protein